VSGFPDHAGGLGQALIALRDKYGPSVRLGWHASNFRAGNSPEVVTAFYSSMGSWDVLMTEQPHLEADEKTWWDPWDPARVATNVNWFQTVSGSAKVPILLWQAQIGTTDFHFFNGDTTALAQLAQAGFGGVLFDMRGNGNPDDFRAFESADLATVPPVSTMAGGTAADMRTRLAAYAKSPLAWPAGSPCADGGGTGGSSSSTGSGNAGSGDNGGSAGTGGSGGDGGGDGGKAGGGADSGACGCHVIGRGAEDASAVLAVALGAAALGRRRRRKPR